MKKAFEEQKNDKKIKPKRKSRAKVLSATDFFKVTKEILLTKYSPKEQNDIVRELYFTVREFRKMEIEKLNSDMDVLVKLNKEIPVDNE